MNKDEVTSLEQRRKSMRFQGWRELRSKSCDTYGERYDCGIRQVHASLAKKIDSDKFADLGDSVFITSLHFHNLLPLMHTAYLDG